MTAKMPYAGFRRQLREQLPILQSEGLISQTQAQSISERYRLGSLGTEITHSLITAIYTISSILIGIGIISFIAAHWENIDRGTKVIMIFAVMFAAHFAGFYLWQIRRSHPKLGHSLILLGTLIFGANIGLIAQIFHVRENPYNGFFFWAIGALAVAYALKSTPNAILAIITAGIYAIGNATENFQFSAYFPLIAIVLFVPFIYYARSQAALWLTLLLLGITIPLSMAEHENGLMVCVSFAITGLLFFSWGTVSHQKDKTGFISVPAWTGGILFTAIILYLCSFLDFCDDLLRHWNAFTEMRSAYITAGSLLTAAVIMTVLSLSRKASPILKALTVLLFVALSAVLLLPFYAPAYAVAALANILFTALVILLFRAAFTYQDRRIFWASVLLAATLILGRTLEYDFGLLIKAAVFIACGIGLMVGGILFEKFLKSGRTVND